MAQIYDPHRGWIDSSAGNVNTTGLDPSGLSTSYTPASYTGASQSPFDLSGGTMISPASQTTTYSGPGGQWTSQGGTWRSGTGQTVNDLAGYLQMRGQQQAGANISPYLSQLQNLLQNPSSITQTPGYQFQLQQGQQALERSAAAKGALSSGNVLQALQQQGQGLASQEYGNQINRLQSLLGQAEQFGAGTGYYQPPQTQSTQAGFQVPGYRPSVW